MRRTSHCLFLALLVSGCTQGERAGVVSPEDAVTASTPATATEPASVAHGSMPSPTGSDSTRCMDVGAVPPGQKESPDVFVCRFLSNYLADDGDDVNWTSDWFSEDVLSAKKTNDRACADVEGICGPDYDFIAQGQDTPGLEDVFAKTIGGTSGAAGSNRVEVTFDYGRHGGAVVKTTYILIPAGNGWKIDNVLADDDFGGRIDVYRYFSNSDR